MKNRPIMGWARNLLLLALVAASPPNGTRYLTGRLVGLSGTSIRLSTRADGKQDAPSAFFDAAVDSGTEVLVDRVVDGSVVGEKGKFADLKVGQTLVVTVNGKKAIRIRVPLPPPITGEVVSADSRAICVRTPQGMGGGKPVSQSFLVDKQTAVVLDVGAPRPRRADVSGIVPGRYVSVYTSGGTARLVRVVPAPAFDAQILRLAPGLITVRPVRGTPPIVEETFRLPTTAKVLFQYFGIAPADGSVSDLRPGQYVALAADLSTAILVIVRVPPVYGRVGVVGPLAVFGDPEFPTR